MKGSEGYESCRLVLDEEYCHLHCMGSERNHWLAVCRDQINSHLHFRNSLMDTDNMQDLILKVLLTDICPSFKSLPVCERASWWQLSISGLQQTTVELASWVG